MKTRLLQILLAASLVAVAAFVAFTAPASAQQQTIWVKLASGQIVQVTVDVPPGVPLSDIQLPGVPVPAPTTPTVPTTPTTPSTPKAPSAPKPPSQPSTPKTPNGTPQAPSGNDDTVEKQKKKAKKKLNGGTKVAPLDEVKKKVKRHAKKSPLRNTDGTPTSDNPGFVDALP